MLREWKTMVAACILALCIILVFMYDRHDRPQHLKPKLPPPGPALEVRLIGIGDKKKEEPKSLRLAVVVPKERIFDDMGQLLDSLGSGYKFDSIAEQELRNEPSLLDRSRFDVVFLTCSNGGDEYKDRLREFVADGGILYASDLRFGLLAKAFPTREKKNFIGSGIRQDVVAEVVDPELREALGGGPTVNLRFDLDGWVTAAFAGPGVTVLAQGTYRKTKSNEEAQAPLMVKFYEGEGTVIFTSFHNEKLNNETAEKLLKHLVFSIVTAREDKHAKEILQEGGFSNRRSNLLTMARDKPSITYTYSNKKAGPLRFVLAFQSLGAQMCLMIRSPDGKSHTWKGDATVGLEVPNASVGEWTYTVTGLSVPYDNFPYIVRVGGKD